MIVIYNNKKIDYLNDYSSCAKDLILSRVEHLPFQSIENIKEIMQNLLEILMEGFKNEKRNISDKIQKRKISTLISKFSNFLKYQQRIKKEDTMIQKIYDLILSLDNLGTLRGFGFSNIFGDKLRGNAEKQSLLNIRTLIDGKTN